MCNCWIGILNAYDQSSENNLTIDNVITRLHERSEHTYNMQSISKNWKGINPNDYIDRRKGLATLFNFCPLCGLKINWSKIRKMIGIKNMNNQTQYKENHGCKFCSHLSICVCDD